MKYVAILLLLLIVGCGVGDLYKLVGHRKFAVGDCLVVGSKEPERWQVHRPQYMVMDIGKYSYHIMYIEFGKSDIYDDITFGHLWEDFYQKVPCK